MRIQIKKVKFFLGLIVICFFSCKAQHQIKSDNIELSIVKDTIKCKSIDNNLFITEYIEVNHVNQIHEKKVQNKIRLYFLNDLYEKENIENLNIYNRECCDGVIENCNFSIQNYVINYIATQFASITGFFNIYGVTPTGNEFNLNINTTTLEIIKLSDILTKEGINFLLKSTNQIVKNSISQEKENWEEDELEVMDSFLTSFPLLDINSLDNYKIIKRGEKLYLKIWYAFNVAKFEQELLPIIDLTYNLEELNSYFKKGTLEMLHN